MDIFKKLVVAHGRAKNDLHNGLHEMGNLKQASTTADPVSGKADSAKAETAMIALAGNPNAGKTTLFNMLTGSRQHVGNYPGITVEKREGFFKVSGLKVQVVDLPGTYSLTAYSEEELVARNFLVEEKPQVVVNVVDATNLERNLYLTVQLLELGVPVIIALNMIDEVKKQGTRINSRRLSALLGVPVVETAARSGYGKGDLIVAIAEQVVQNARPAKVNIHNERSAFNISYSPEVDICLQEMADLISKHNFLAPYPAKWVALKYLENDPEIVHKGASHIQGVSEQLKARADMLREHLENTLHTDPEAVIADYRYGFITALLSRDVISRASTIGRRDVSHKIDQVLTHQFLGPLIMVLIVYGLFKLTFGLGEIPLQWVTGFFAWLGGLVQSWLPDGNGLVGLLRSLLVSGVIDGVGGVLSFVPLILIMFLGLSFLEDSGYMARMAYMLDRVLRIFGLHGCSVMPFIISGGIPGGCAVPGIMAARTLRSPREKLATLLTAPFFSCGAKVPVFLLVCSVFFPAQAASVLFWVTLAAWGFALVIARVLRSTLIKGPATPFVMELPPYRMPTLKGVLIHTWERAWQYIRKAGTVILLISILIWVAMTFPRLPADQQASYARQIHSLQLLLSQAAGQEQEQLSRALSLLQGKRDQAALEYSLAGRLGKAIEPVSKWAGFDWKVNIALLGGFAAKEVIVSTLGTAYSLGEVDSDHTTSLAERIAADPHWNKWVGLSLIAFVLLYAPCFVSVVTIAKESSWKWAVFSVLFNTIFAFALAVAIYQGGQVW